MDEAAARIEELAASGGGRWGIAVEELGVPDPWRFSLHADEPFYAASVIKVPVMVAVYREAARGRFRLSDRVRLRPDDRVGGSGVLHALSPGLRLTVEDLVSLMIIVSDNTATNMAIDLVGREAVRETMAHYGMTNSRFFNKLQVVPEEIEGRNTVTAADMVRLYATIASGRAVSLAASERMVAILKAQQVRDGIGGLLPGGDLPVGAAPPAEAATKSGWVTGIVHDTGLLFLPGRTFAMAFLSEGVADPVEE
ncbi:MAG: serine hydrolase, partial [Dactylosporangium sp.]|nr:serine hydrolase [Dactylosporangium sp.]